MMTSTSRPRKKKALVAAAALLSIGLTGTIATGAYFTDQKIVTNNQLTAGTVVLGNIGDDANSSTPVTFTNVLPIADADVATKAQTFNVHIRNGGTADIGWKAEVASPMILMRADEGGLTIKDKAMVQVSTTDGETWSAPQTFTELQNQGPIENGLGIRPGDSALVKFRVWLPATTGNAYQGASFSFNLVVSAIQYGAPWS